MASWQPPSLRTMQATCAWCQHGCRQQAQRARLGACHPLLPLECMPPQPAAALLSLRMPRWCCALPHACPVSALHSPTHLLGALQRRVALLLAGHQRLGSSRLSARLCQLGRQRGAGLRALLRRLADGLELRSRGLGSPDQAVVNSTWQVSTRVPGEAGAPRPAHELGSMGSGRGSIPNPSAHLGLELGGPLLQAVALARCSRQLRLQLGLRLGRILLRLNRAQAAGRAPGAQCQGEQHGRRCGACARRRVPERASACEQTEPACKAQTAALLLGHQRRVPKDPTCSSRSASERVAAASLRASSSWAASSAAWELSWYCCCSARCRTLASCKGQGRAAGRGTEAGDRG